MHAQQGRVGFAHFTYLFGRDRPGDDAPYIGIVGRYPPREADPFSEDIYRHAILEAGCQVATSLPLHRSDKEDLFGGSGDPILVWLRLRH